MTRMHVSVCILMTYYIVYTDIELTISDNLCINENADDDGGGAGGSF